MLLLARHRQLWSHQNEPGALCPDVAPRQIQSGLAVPVQIEAQIREQKEYREQRDLENEPGASLSQLS